MKIPLRPAVRTAKKMLQHPRGVVVILGFICWWWCLIAVVSSALHGDVRPIGLIARRLPLPPNPPILAEDGTAEESVLQTAGRLATTADQWSQTHLVVLGWIFLFFLLLHAWLAGWRAAAGEVRQTAVRFAGCGFDLFVALQCGVPMTAIVIGLVLAVVIASVGTFVSARRQKRRAEKEVEDAEEAEDSAPETPASQAAAASPLAGVDLPAGVSLPDNLPELRLMNALSTGGRTWLEAIIIVLLGIPAIIIHFLVFL